MGDVVELGPEVEEVEEPRAFDAEAELARQKQLLRNLYEKYVPISEKRLNKMWRAVRETVDEFTNQLVQFQEDRRLQNEAIAGLSAEVQELKQHVLLLTHTAAQDMTEQVTDLANRVLELERGKPDS